MTDRAISILKIIFIVGCLFVLLCIYGAVKAEGNKAVQKVTPEVTPKFEHKVDKDLPDQPLMGPTVYVFEVDGHEYIAVIAGQGVAVAHSAGCKNPVHRPPEWNNPKPNPTDKEKTCL